MEHATTGRIMLEVVPPSKRASPENVAKSIERISSEVNKNGYVDCLNIPEIIEENHEGRPYYRNIDARYFGKLLREKTRRKIIVNKVVAHLSQEQFKAWIDETVSEFDTNDMIFVGASRGSSNYAGPSIVEANQYAVGLRQSGKFKNLNVGNILIPERAGEVERAVSKTSAGCSFFTTQIIFQAQSFNYFAEAYCGECKRLNLKPSLVFLSFAPVTNAEDIEFFGWLGCEIPETVRERLTKSENMARASIEFSKETLSSILYFSRKNNPELPLALNVEAIFLQNLDYAVEMLQALVPLLH